MKFTLEGFSQESALSLAKKVDDKNLKLDVIDLILLRWFVDFAPTMKKKIVNDVQYMWVNYQSIVDDLPLLGMEKTSVYRRFKKMCDLEILTHHHDKNGGSFSYYGYGENYIKLIKKDPMTQKSDPMTQKSDPLRLKSSNKDSSTINNSSTSKVSKVRKEEKKETQPSTPLTCSDKEKQEKSYNEIIDDYTDNETLRKELKEHLKVRKMKNALPTNHGLILDLQKLDEISFSVLEKIEIVKKSIEHCWTSFFPLNDSDSYRLTFDKIEKYGC